MFVTCCCDTSQRLAAVSNGIFRNIVPQPYDVVLNMSIEMFHVEVDCMGCCFPAPPHV